MSIIHNILNSSDTEFDQRDASDAKCNTSTNTKQTKPNALKVGQQEHVKSSFPDKKKRAVYWKLIKYLFQ